MVAKFEVAKEKYEIALQKKIEMDGKEKVEAYNKWRMEEEKRGRAQDEHGKNLVKVMLQSVKSAPPNAVSSSMCNVMGNLDSRLNIPFIKL